MLLAAVNRDLFLAVKGLHILASTVGFGGVMLAGVYGRRAAGLGGSEGLAVSQAVYDVSAKWAAPFQYLVFLTGILLVLVSDGDYKFDEEWISVSMVLYLGIIALRARRAAPEPATHDRAQPPAARAAAPAARRRAGPGARARRSVAAGDDHRRCPRPRRRWRDRAHALEARAVVHPIERLRLVARADAEGRSSLLAREAASALAMFSDDPAGLVTACRRLVDRHPTAGPMWWLAARVLVSGDPAGEAWRAAEELDDDPTASVLAACIPDDAVVTVLGWPEQASSAFGRRAATCAPSSSTRSATAHALVRRLSAAGSDSAVVPESGVGAAAASSGLVLLEAGAAGGDGFVAVAGSRAAAAVAHHAGVAVWAVAGLGRVLPAPMWRALRAEVEDVEEPWEDVEEVVPADLVDAVVRPTGVLNTAEALAKPDCGMAPGAVAADQLNGQAR